MSEISAAIERLAPILGAQGGEPDPLDGTLTNANYRVRFGPRDYVVRLPGKDIELLGLNRLAELAASEVAAAEGVGPEVAAMLEEPPCIVTEYLGARTMTREELRRPEFIVDVAADLRRMHGAAQALPNAFSAFRIVEDYSRTATERGAALPDCFEEAMGHAGRIERALIGPEHEPVPCHNDLLAENFLHDGERLWIVDWEYAGMGDRYFDLGSFAANNELSVDDEFALLTAYFDERPPARRMAALGLMRFMSDFRTGMWALVQSAVSGRRDEYSAYASEHFDRVCALAEDPRFDRWVEEASG